MDLKSFHQELLSTVRIAADASRDFVRAAFVENVGARLCDAEEISDFQICHYEGPGMRNRRLEIDGYARDEADGSMSFLIANFADMQKSVFRSNIIDKSPRLYHFYYTTLKYIPNFRIKGYG